MCQGWNRSATAGDPPWDRSGLQEVVEQARYTSDRMALHLAPRFESDAPLAFAKRRDGAPCDVADCPYAFVLAVPTRSRDGAERAAGAQFEPGATRYFVELRLLNACVMSCEELRQIDERKLRDADPTANATLRWLREAGADVLLIRGERSRRTAVVFKQAIGRSVEVMDEAAATLQHDGTWVREALEPARSHDRWPALARKPRWLRDRPRVGRVAWELAIAFVCFLLAPPVAAVAGTSVTVPVWAELLLGATVAALAVATTRRALLPARAEHARSPEVRACQRASAPLKPARPAPMLSMRDDTPVS
jgi:hypothetical protein